MVLVTVSSLDGCQVNQELDNTSLVSALHQLVLHKLKTHLSLDTSRLIHISGRGLDGDKTLQEENIKEKDDILLIKRRLKEPSESSERDNPEVPDSVVQEIVEALPETENRSKSGVTEKLSETNSIAHVLLTRIIVTLVDCAEMLQYDRLTEEDSKTEMMYSSCDVSQIQSLGFTEEQAKAALAANCFVLDTAIEWLLAGNTTQAASSSGHSSRYRPRRRRGVFKPDPDAVKTLVEMGFPDAEVIKALETTRNNQTEACNHLLGERPDTLISSEMYTPLPRNHALYKLVMERSDIQKALLTPKFLDAMRDLEDKRATIVDFSEDPDVGPILFQLSKAIQKYSSQH